MTDKGIVADALPSGRRPSAPMREMNMRDRRNQSGTSARSGRAAQACRVLVACAIAWAAATGTAHGQNLALPVPPAPSLFAWPGAPPPAAHRAPLDLVAAALAEFAPVPPAPPGAAPALQPAALVQEELGPPRVMPPAGAGPLERVVESKVTLNLTLQLPQLLQFKENVKRVQLGGGKTDIAEVIVITPREYSVIGTKLGRTSLNLWFADPKDATKERVFSYILNIQPDEQRMRNIEKQVQRYVKDLENQVNQAFPDSKVSLNVVGQNVIVTGQARDVMEGTQILSLVAPRRFSQGYLQGIGQPTTVIQHGLTQTTVQKIEPEPVPVDQAPVKLLQEYDAIAPLYRRFTVVNQLRIPGEPQVMLKVVVAEVNRTAVRNLGVNFSISNASGIVFANATGGLLSSLTTSGGASSTTNLTTGGNNLALRIANGQGNILGLIEALKVQNLARSLAEPNIVAINGQPGSFHVGGEFPVPIVTGYTSAGLSGVSFVPFGVSVNFTPYVTDKDRVRLRLMAQVSTRDNSNSATVNGTTVPSLNARTFFTTVELRQGDTLAVGGLIQSNYAAGATRVPFFGELPYIGRMLGTQNTSNGEQELIILVTPVLVRPADHCQLMLPGNDVYEPNDWEFYLKGQLEANRAIDYRSGIRTDTHRDFEYRSFNQPSIVPPYQVPPGFTAPYMHNVPPPAQYYQPPGLNPPLTAPPAPSFWQRLWNR